ncbi:MAG: SCO family protein [Pseudohongiellaceae bacterium]
MKRNIRITLALCLLWVVIVLLITWNRYADNNETAPDSAGTATPMTEEALREIGARVYPSAVALEPFTLQTHEGERFTGEHFKGQWDLVFFGFTNCPDICPLTMRELETFYRDLTGPLAEQTRVIMVSVDPFRDDAEQVGEYVQGFHPDFLGLRGELDAVSNLAGQLYVAHSDPPPSRSGDYLIDHSGNILLINPDGDYHGFMESGIRSENIDQAFRAILADW